MRLPSILFFLALAIAATQPALAGCQLAEAPTKSFEVQAGASTDSVTGNRGSWNEQYFVVSQRDGHRANYVQVTNDQRFGQSDTTYEGGASLPVNAHLIATAMLSFSPTHLVLPNSVWQTGLDVRGANGYGYQGSYAQRNYTGAIANIATVGADRYVGKDHYSLFITAVRLSNVPGTAMLAGVTYARYLRCDTLSFALSGGRDVENTGVGSNVAIYQTINYSARDLHWFTPHLAVSLGAGWYVLNGAYNRFQLEVALHERL